MRFRFSGHARTRRHQRRVTRAEIARVLEHPDERIRSDLYTWRYIGRVEGRLIKVVIAFDTDPPTVLTVLARRRRRR